MAKQKEKYENKAYRLTGNQYPLSYMLASRHSKRSPLLHFDDDQGINRPLRYARNQKSPFEDEQDGNAILEPIVFEDGMLMVEKQNQALQQFLHYHPSNGMVFEEINNSRDAAEELQHVEMELEAQIEAKKITNDVDKLTSVCRVLMGNHVDNMTIPELKRDILLYAKARPEDFMDTINDPMLELMDTIHQFMMAGFIVYRNNNKDVYYNLPNNKKKMLTVPYGEDPNYIIGSFMQSDEGLEVFKLLKNKLKNKK
ncbi:hypothetical protein N9H34_01160 [bacterium]|nr:hypothetical protein [bacterium]MDA9247033.1 hypothetical protein [Flavobacteriaceae bacterium]MDB4277638.1 hypothetical protein [Gammaproteobacteria bacterium]